MPSPSFVVLYVESPAASSRFYSSLLGRDPVESSATFVLFALESGVMLGLWAKRGVLPPATAPGGTELAFTAAGADEVRSVHADWVTRGLSIAQAPTELDFGFTFVALDPDGHRLRVFAPSAP